MTNRVQNMKSCLGSISTVLVAATLFWAARPMGAQARQVTDSLAYYPLHMGNEWHYDISALIVPRSQVVRVVGDSTMVSGRTYRKLMVKVYYDLDTDPEPSFRFERVDSASGIVYRYRENRDEDEAVMHLALSGMDQGELFELQGTELPFLARCGDNYQAEVLGHQPLAKSCFFGGEMVDMNSYSLARGIGLYHVQVQPHPDFTDEFFTLVYARVDGQSFGTPLATGKEHPRELPSAPVLEVYPNPASDQITFSSASNSNARFSTGSMSTASVSAASLPGAPAHLEVFDVLGRRVWKSNQNTGDVTASSIRINVSQWPAGVYVARLRSGAASSTRMVVVDR